MTMQAGLCSENECDSNPVGRAQSGILGQVPCTSCALKPIIREAKLDKTHKRISKMCLNCKGNPTLVALLSRGSIPCIIICY